jgi:hypothetical protein
MPPTPPAPRALSRTAIALLTLGLAFALIAGCGGRGQKGSSESGPANAKPPSKADYVARANKVCAALNEKTRALEGRYLSGAKAASADAARTFAAKEAPLVRSALSKLKALRAPRGDGRRVGAFLKETNKGVRKLERASAHGEQARRILRRGGPFGPAQELALSYGLSSCAQRG